MLRAYSLLPTLFRERLKGSKSTMHTHIIFKCFCFLDSVYSPKKAGDFMYKAFNFPIGTLKDFENEIQDFPEWVITMFIVWCINVVVEILSNFLAGK